MVSGADCIAKAVKLTGSVMLVNVYLVPFFSNRSANKVANESYIGRYVFSKVSVSPLATYSKTRAIPISPFRWYW